MQANFVAALRAADAAIAELPVPAHAPPSAPARARRWRIAPWLAVPALALAALVLWIAVRDTAPKRPALAELSIVRASDTAIVNVRPGGEHIAIERGLVELYHRRAGLDVAVTSPTTLRSRADGIVLERGAIFVVADHRAATERAAIAVSGGTIYVVGTRFTVEQEADRGRVHLIEGAILFVATDGRELTVRPGETVEWPLVKTAAIVPPPPTTPAPPPIEPTTRPAPPPKPTKKQITTAPEAPTVEQPAPTTTELLEEVAMLRDRRQYTAAVAKLRGALSSALPATSRERLSYELGSILTHHLRDRDAACTHWKAHASEFPRGRYDNDVATARSSLGCP